VTAAANSTLDPCAPQAAEQRGLVFDIQRFSLHDGSGIRTVVFMKGCPLRCRWCANPEGIARHPEIMVSSSKCIGDDDCGHCVSACPRRCVGRDEQGRRAIDRDCCERCSSCVEACPASALETAGRLMTVDELLTIVESDSVFYARSGGGLTVSGGEPLMQAGFVQRLLEKAQQRGIDTCLETTGHGRFEDLAALCAHLDAIYFDIKSADAERHRRWTGVSNKLILQNFAKLLRNFPSLPIVVRTPVVPGFNDTEADIAAIARLLRAPRAIKHELLSYHALGAAKYHRLDKPYPMAVLTPPSAETMAALRIAAA